MNKTTMRLAWAEIHLGHIDDNIKQLKKKAGSAQIIGVVKADGYGHGALPVAQVLQKNGVTTLAVATLQEAITLREEGVSGQIIVFSAIPPLYAEMVIDHQITATITCLAHATAIADAAQRKGRTAEAVLAIDTGMGRLGFLPAEESVAEIKEISRLKGLHLSYLSSHFSTADEQDKSYALAQLDCYEKFCQQLAAADVHIASRSMANSAAIMELPHTYFDAVRPGIVLYGCYPSAQVDRGNLSLQPAMSIKAKISYLKTVPAQFSIGYGKLFTTEKESLIATLPLGYADGYSRCLSGKGRVIVNGVYAPVVGNICMDQCMIDVTHVPHVKMGDEVVLMGNQKGLSITAEELAEKTGTINYEILCAFGQRLPKVYLAD